jgi:hypothetical protein
MKRKEKKVKKRTKLAPPFEKLTQAATTITNLVIKPLVIVTVVIIFLIALSPPSSPVREALLKTGAFLLSIATTILILFCIIPLIVAFILIVRVLLIRRH